MDIPSSVRYTFKRYDLHYIHRRVALIRLTAIIIATVSVMIGKVLN